jgi:hypothetical protein
MKVINWGQTNLHQHNQPGNKMFGPNLYNQESGKRQFIFKTAPATPSVYQSRSPRAERSLDFSRDLLMSKMGEGPTKKPK